MPTLWGCDNVYKASGIKPYTGNTVIALLHDWRVLPVQDSLIFRPGLLDPEAQGKDYSFLSEFSTRMGSTPSPVTLGESHRQQLEHSTWKERLFSFSRKTSISLLSLRRVWSIRFTDCKTWVDSHLIYFHLFITCLKIRSSLKLFYPRLHLKS